MSMSWDQAASLNQATKVIAVADVVESVRLMEQDEQAFIRRWQGFVGFVLQHLAHHAGRLHKSLGDGLMLEFSDPENCILAAHAMHAWFGAGNQDLGPEDHVHLRIGAHLAHFVADAYDIYGNDVNLAARIASLAGPGEIVISAALRNSLDHSLETQVEDLGTCHLKHVRAPVHAFRIGQAGRAPVMAASAYGAQSWGPLLEVVPFAVRARDEDSVVGDTFAEDIVTALTAAGHVQVVSRLPASNVMQAEAPRRTQQQEIEPAYVLSGHARRHAAELCVYAELTDARCAHVAWAQSFLDRLDDTGGAETRVARQIGAMVQAAVIAHEATRAHGQPLPALDGSTLLLAAISLMHRLAAPDLERAEAMLEHLADRWPRHPAPHAWLAHLHVLQWQQGSGTGAAEAARAEAARALHCEGAGALPLAVDGRVRLHLAGDMQAAEERYAQALALNPGDALAMLFRAECKALRGDGAAARTLLAAAAERLPLAPMLYLHEVVGAQAALADGDTAQALRLATAAVERSPCSQAAHEAQAAALATCGRAGEARDALARLRERCPDLPETLSTMPAGVLREQFAAMFAAI